MFYHSFDIILHLLFLKSIAIFSFNSLSFFLLSYILSGIFVSFFIYLIIFCSLFCFYFLSLFNAFWRSFLIGSFCCFSLQTFAFLRFFPYWCLSFFFFLICFFEKQQRKKELKENSISSCCVLSCGTNGNLFPPIIRA